MFSVECILSNIETRVQFMLQRVIVRSYSIACMNGFMSSINGVDVVRAVSHRPQGIISGLLSSRN
jgi:hypothetical protein